MAEITESVKNKIIVAIFAIVPKTWKQTDNVEKIIYLESKAVCWDEPTLKNARDRGQSLIKSWKVFFVAWQKLRSCIVVTIVEYSAM